MPLIERITSYECPLCFIAFGYSDSNFKKCKSCKRIVCVDCGCINENCKLYSELYKIKERKK